MSYFPAVMRALAKIPVARWAKGLPLLCSNAATSTPHQWLSITSSNTTLSMSLVYISGVL
jgi:hypothetical protein